MATNKIYPFAHDSEADVLSDVDYESDAQREIGNQVGIARQELVNKVLKQCSFISSSLAQFVVNKAGADVTDTDDVNTFITNFINSIKVANPAAAATAAQIIAGTVGFVVSPDQLMAAGLLQFTRGGSLVNTIDYIAAMNVSVWVATCACTVTNIRGYRVGGDSSVSINARRNGSATKHLATDKTLASADIWYDGGAVQDAVYAIGDKLEIMVVHAAGNPTQIAVQVDFTRS